MRFTNHKITKSQITKSQKVFAIIIKKSYIKKHTGSGVLCVLF